jgi:hypothetical protein
VKITPVDDGLVQIHLEQGEDMRTAAPLISSFSRNVAVQIIGLGLSIRVDRTDTEPPVDPPGEAQGQTRADAETPPTAAPNRRQQPKKIFISAKTAPALEVLRRYPGGLTSKRVAEILDVTHSTASSAIYRLRGPIELVENLQGGLFRLTSLGERVKIKVVTDRSAARQNRQIGWGPWMTTSQG